MSNIMKHSLFAQVAATSFQATDILGWLFTLGLAGSVWQGIKHAQRAYRAQDKQDKLEESGMGNWDTCDLRRGILVSR